VLQFKRTRNQPPLRGQLIIIRARCFNLAHLLFVIANRFADFQRTRSSRAIERFIKANKLFMPGPRFTDY